MSTVQSEVDERAGLTASNKFELMLFRLGKPPGADRSEIYGINVFKLRELIAMPEVTTIADGPKHLLGMVNIRGQIVPVIDLCAVIGCIPEGGHKILMVTEFARTTQAFAVEDVDEIVRLNWSQVRPAESCAAGNGTITSIAQLDAPIHDRQLAQILDVEQILREVFPPRADLPKSPSANVALDSAVARDATLLVVDDSSSARSIISAALTEMGLKFVLAKSGKEAWERLEAMAAEARTEGKAIATKVTLVLTDLEMPEMDGFTLTRKIRGDTRFAGLPIIIHSSLSGATNEQHVKSAGADGYVAKFKIEELAATIRDILQKYSAGTA
jgi:two-component system chemotaxis response regulator CheV